jgi:hypothetical protein
MCKELATSPAGEEFIVDVFKREYAPPLVLCPGLGTNCLWKSRFKNTPICTVTIQSVKPGEFGVYICGKSSLEDC